LHGTGREENKVTRTDEVGDPVYIGLHHALLHDHEKQICVARVSDRIAASRRRCRVNLEIRERHGRGVEETPADIVGHRLRLNLVPVHHTGAERSRRSPLRGWLVADGMHGVGAEIDHVKGGRLGAAIHHRVDIVGCEKNDVAGRGRLRLAIDGNFQRPVLDDQNFLPGMTVRRVRCLAGIERADLQLESLQRRRGCVKDRARNADRRGSLSQRGPIDKRRANRWDRAGRFVGTAGGTVKGSAGASGEATRAAVDSDIRSCIWEMAFRDWTARRSERLGDPAHDIDRIPGHDRESTERRAGRPPCGRTTPLDSIDNGPLVRR